MFHRQCAVSLPKNAGYFPAEFVHETKSGAAAQHFVQCLFCGGRSGMAAACALTMCSGKIFFDSAVRRVCGRTELRFL
jgi:hypothetical protein